MVNFWKHASKSTTGKFWKENTSIPKDDERTGI
jgi:hypothetical protein